MGGTESASADATSFVTASLCAPLGLRRRGRQLQFVGLLDGQRLFRKKHCTGQDCGRPAIDGLVAQICLLGHCLPSSYIPSTRRSAIGRIRNLLILRAIPPLAILPKQSWKLARQMHSFATNVRNPHRL